MITDYNLVFGVSTEPREKCTEYVTPLENKILIHQTDEASASVSLGIIRKYLDYSVIPGEIIAGLYDENDVIKETKTVTLSDCNIQNSDSTFTIDFTSENGAYIKLMWWDLTTLSPISKSVIDSF
jgi:hypothetical protein